MAETLTAVDLYAGLAPFSRVLHTAVRQRPCTYIGFAGTLFSDCGVTPLASVPASVFERGTAAVCRRCVPGQPIPAPYIPSGLGWPSAQPEGRRGA